MELISQIEVSYFRSIHKGHIDGCSGTNVIFGRNDAGKSNFLRALNLFFNNETNPGQKFAFSRDFNHARQADADLAAAQEKERKKFVYVKIWFKTPNSFKKSLGESFWVKKQWNMTTEERPNLYSSVDDDKSIYLTRLLNQIKFHYIPAIKDRRIFEKLQAEIYNVISQNVQFSESLREFAATLQLRTAELTVDIADRLHINSSVSTPQDLTDLFRSLDFETKTDQGDLHSLTLQRGDGIQVQHIPPILGFISDQSTSNYHIWGFEEPENSLELANAIKEAETFKNFGSSKNKQIFLTSHSPAFFSLTDKDVSRYFVSKTEMVNERHNSTIKIIKGDAKQSPADLMGELPHLAVISSYLSEAKKKIDEQAKANQELNEQLDNFHVPILFGEGDSDVLIFQHAWRVLFEEEPDYLHFAGGGGTTKMEALRSDGRILQVAAHARPLFALVDNDSEGRELYSNGRLNGGGRWHKHNSNGVHWCRLPFEAGFSAFMTRLKIPQSAWPGTLENMFPLALRRQAIEEGALFLGDVAYAELFQPQFAASIMPYLSPRADFEHVYVMTPHQDAKVPFAQWIIAQSAHRPDIFEGLRVTLTAVRDLILNAE
ncbi:ATP-dependent nuclease [Burkholderia gladioli]|uniref:ATP-dependent nuclease n=1 Tax=Burkholderia gladioli TaxID=28095 RepID=UPI0022D40E36|nr:AAA family ATPase [Burkholderia gladioli]MDA0576233.1 AAA family ATPase [Burkholderia gladioli]MDA0604328.1 AAA family ATPase [Burkholderia gladioli]